jgi:hypothetical protein
VSGASEIEVVGEPFQLQAHYKFLFRLRIITATPVASNKGTPMICTSSAMAGYCFSNSLAAKITAATVIKRRRKRSLQNGFISLPSNQLGHRQILARLCVTGYAVWEQPDGIGKYDVGGLSRQDRNLQWPRLSL